MALAIRDKEVEPLAEELSALARVEGEALPHKGEDFDRTDLKWKPS